MIANDVEWVARQAGARFVIQYFDDILILGVSHSGKCATATQKLFGDI